MALTKITRGLLNTGVSDSSDATAITIDSSEKVGLNGLSAGDYWSSSNQLVLGNTASGANGGLTIATASDAVGQIYFADGTSGDAQYRGQIQYTHVSDAMDFQTAAGFRMRIDSSGNVGIGTASPNTVLHTATGSNGSGLIDVGRFQNTGTSVNDGARIQLTAGTSTSGAGIGCLGYALNSAHLVFHSGGNNERMRLKQDGDFSVGTTGGTHRLESHSNKVNYACAKFLSNTGSGSTEYGFISQLNGDPNNTTNYLYLGGSPSTTRFVVYSNGNVANTNNSYGAYSDVKLKENIVDANPQLEKIKQLQVRNFNLKAEPDKKLIGLVAQEAETIFPKLIDVTEDTENDEDGAIVKTGETTKSIKYSVFVPVLIKAIQELSTKLEAAEARITTLEG